LGEATAPAAAHPRRRSAQQRKAAARGRAAPEVEVLGLESASAGSGRRDAMGGREGIRNGMDGVEEGRERGGFIGRWWIGP